MLQEKADKIENDKKNHKKIIDSKVFEIEQKLKKDLHVELTQKINEENKTKNDLFKKME